MTLAVIQFAPYSIISKPKEFIRHRGRTGLAFRRQAARRHGYIKKEAVRKCSGTISVQISSENALVHNAFFAISGVLYRMQSQMRRKPRHETVRTPHQANSRKTRHFASAVLDLCSEIATQIKTRCYIVDIEIEFLVEPGAPNLATVPHTQLAAGSWCKVWVPITGRDKNHHKK